MKIKVHIVNAFTANSQGGNPAGVVLQANGLTKDQMQKIATIIGASETVFVLPSKNSTHKFRFFTPTQEVDLCGHATVACWSLMHKRGMHVAKRYTQETLAGNIKVEINNDGRVFIQMPTGKMGETFDTELIAKTLGIEAAALSAELPPRFIDKDLMICLNSEATLNNLQSDSTLLTKLSKDHNFYDFHVFVLEDQGDVFAHVRNFCPVLGIEEDAATGTTNGNFLSYLNQLHTLPSRPTYIIEQGKVMGRTSHIHGKYIDGSIWIGGNANTVEEREIEL